MPYKVKGKCIYKKKSDGSLGKKVGCTKGSVDKYLSALHANVNESNDFGWASEIPNDIDFDLWDSIANIIDEESSQGPAYEFWVGSESYNTLKDILYDYNLDIDNMEDFFQFPPQDKFGNYLTEFKLMELKDDLNNNGFGDSDDLFEDVIREDFEWTKNIKASLKPGETYRVKNHNGTWTNKVYCGKGETDHPSTGEMIMGHRFRDLNSRSDKCDEWWSKQSLIDKIENDSIHEYDPNWSILNDINFGSLDDIDGRNFAIYFENGVDIDETTELQKKLFDMGYHFPGREGEFKPVTKKDTEGKKIILFECYNWDTSNERYRQMPPDFRDRGVMLMVTDNPDNFFRDDQELSRQYTLSTVIDHDAIVVNGYDYLDNRHLNESDDFDWIRDIEEFPIPGTAWVMEINPEDSEEVQHKLFDAGFGWSFGGKQIQTTPGITAFVSYGGWDISDKNFKWVPNGSYNLDYIIRTTQPNELFIYEYKGGVSKLKNTNLNESDGFDWIKDVEPFRVGDVFHTRLDFTPKDLNAEVTFEIYDISPDGKWVRFRHHKGSMYKGTYIDIDKINSETISRGWDKSGYSRANSLETDQVLKNINGGFWKKVNVPGYLDSHPEKKDEIIKLGTNINESDEFSWIQDIPAADEYRFFDMYVCGDNQYDEETGEDECLDGGSYFLKIPKQEVIEIWDLNVWDVGGPGDEGSGVIEWGVKNDKFDPYEFSFVEYVMEISQEEYCRAAGNYRGEDKQLCKGYVNESNDFDWAKGDLPPFYTLEWKDHPLAVSAREIWDEMNTGGEFTPPQFNLFKNLKLARKDYPNGKWISVISGPNWIPSAFVDNPTDPDDVNSDRLRDRFEVMSSEMEEPQIMTVDEINQYMEDFESSHNINESNDFDWIKNIPISPENMIHVGAVFNIKKFGGEDGSVSIKIIDKYLSILGEDAFTVEVIESDSPKVSVGGTFNLTTEKTLKNNLIGNYWVYDHNRSTMNTD